MPGYQGFGRRGGLDEVEEELTEGWYWQEPSGLSSSVNTASQPIRWHLTGAAVPLFAAASVVVDIAGALSLSPSPRRAVWKKSGKISLALEPTEGIKQGAAGHGRPPQNGSESNVRANGTETDTNTQYFSHPDLYYSNIRWVRLWHFF